MQTSLYLGVAKISKKWYFVVEEGLALILNMAASLRVCLALVAGLSASFESHVALHYTPVTSRSRQAYSAVTGVTGYSP